MTTDDHTGDVQRGCAVRRASCGELTFDADVDPIARPVIQSLWTERLAGFNQLDLPRYLRNNSDDTRYVTNGRRYKFRTFRFACRCVFPVLRVVRWLGIRLTADVLDPHVSICGNQATTRGILVLRIGRRTVRQSRVTLSAVHAVGGWTWDRAEEQPMRRNTWPYRFDSAVDQWRQTAGED
ncbi:MAG: hypothetical protein HOP29_00370 [Phycisphaerales bacterium]|nr:hypothetical protein [Phycisphaerales bacterium]